MSEIKTITVGGTTYTLPEGTPVFVGTKAQWNALTAQQKAVYDESNNGLVIITDDCEVQAEIDDTTPASNKVYSSQKVENTFAKKSDMPVWTSATSALTGATSCTITDSAISSTSVLEVFYENTSGKDPVAKVTSVSGTTATISFKALAENTDFRLRVTNL